jgi:nitrogen PTS system EIIA component
LVYQQNRRSLVVHLLTESPDRIGSLPPAGKRESATTRVAELLSADDIVLDLEVSCKDQLIEQVSRHMQRVHGLPHHLVAVSLFRRERIASTALGEGVAIPHARVKELDQIRVAYARAKSPICFDAPDGKPVSAALVLLVPKQATEEHLTILAEATQMLSDRRFRERLECCKHPLEVKRVFDSWRGAAK